MCAGYYSVTPVKFGLSVTLSDSAHGSYNITVTASSGKTRNEQLSHNKNESVVNVTNLEPCTEYTTTVTFTSNGSDTNCKAKGSETIRTEEMGEYNR